MFWLGMVKNGCCQSCQSWLYLKNEQKELTDLFCYMLVQIHTNWNFLEIFEVTMVKNEFGQFADGTLKMGVSEEWADNNRFFILLSFLACWYRSIKIKSWSKVFWVGMVKNQAWMLAPDIMQCPAKNCVQQRLLDNECSCPGWS